MASDDSSRMSMVESKHTRVLTATTERQRLYLPVGSVQDSAIWQSLCVYLSLRAFPFFFWCLLYERKLEKAAGMLCGVLMHKAWWRGDSDPPFPLPGTIEGKDAPSWSGEGCVLQSTGQVGSTDFKCSDYWEANCSFLKLAFLPFSNEQSHRSF